MSTDLEQRVADAMLEAYSQRKIPHLMPALEMARAAIAAVFDALTKLPLHECTEEIHTAFVSFVEIRDLLTPSWRQDG